MNGSPAEYTIIDYLVLAFSSHTDIAKDLGIEKTMPYWEVKNKIITAYGPSIFAEVKRLATMDWRELAAVTDVVIAFANNKGKDKHLISKLFDIIMSPTYDLNSLDGEQLEIVKNIITEIQFKWLSCLPKTLDN